MKSFGFSFSLILIGIMFGAAAAFSQQGEPQTDTIPPIMLVKPILINVEHPEGRFVEREVKVFNRGGGSLKIQSISASCSCSSGKTLQSDIHPLESGRVILSINLDGLHDNNNTVEFRIESNAKNSPVTVRITVNDNKNKTDADKENK